MFVCLQIFHSIIQSGFLDFSPANRSSPAFGTPDNLVTISLSGTAFVQCLAMATTKDQTSPVETVSSFERTGDMPI